VLLTCMAHYVFNTHYLPKHNVLYAVIEHLLGVAASDCTQVSHPSALPVLKYLK
jgi:hypothetical protein